MPCDTGWRWIRGHVWQGGVNLIVAGRYEGAPFSRRRLTLSSAMMS